MVIGEFDLATSGPRYTDRVIDLTTVDGSLSEQSIQPEQRLSELLGQFRPEFREIEASPLYGKNIYGLVDRLYSAAQADLPAKPQVKGFADFDQRADAYVDGLTAFGGELAHLMSVFPVDSAEAEMLKEEFEIPSTLAGVIEEEAAKMRPGVQAMIRLKEVFIPSLHTLVLRDDVALNTVINFVAAGQNDEEPELNPLYAVLGFDWYVRGKDSVSNFILEAALARDIAPRAEFIRKVLTDPGPRDGRLHDQLSFLQRFCNLDTDAFVSKMASEPNWYEELQKSYGELHSKLAGEQRHKITGRLKSWAGVWKQLATLDDITELSKENELMKASLSRNPAERNKAARTLSARRQQKLNARSAKKAKKAPQKAEAKALEPATLVDIVYDPQVGEYKINGHSDAEIKEQLANEISEQYGSEDVKDDVVRSIEHLLSLDLSQSTAWRGITKLKSRTDLRIEGNGNCDVYRFKPRSAVGLPLKSKIGHQLRIMFVRLEGNRIAIFGDIEKRADTNHQYDRRR